MPPELSPRIYCINPLLVGASGWPRLLDHCVALGFDHILIAHDAGGSTASDDDNPGLEAAGAQFGCDLDRLGSAHRIIVG